MVLYHARAVDVAFLVSRYVARWAPATKDSGRVYSRGPGLARPRITQTGVQAAHLIVTGSQKYVATALRWRTIMVE